MGVKDKRDSSISPVLFKFGVALAVSLGGFVYTFLRSKGSIPFKPKHLLPSPGKGSKVDSRRENGEFRGDNRALQNSMNALSSSNRSDEGRGDFLLAELDQLIKEYDVAVDDVSSRVNRQSLQSGAESPSEHEECIKEINSLRCKVQLLEEREKLLENQLLEYYGLKEQETAVMELQNRLKVHNMEVKLYNLKIESLQSDNKKLQAIMADHEKVVKELESAQEQIKLLRKKLRSEGEQNREQILSLQERVMKLKDQETRPVGIDRDVEMEIRKKKELEEEIEEMKKCNRSLTIENSDLARKLEDLQILATSALDNKEVQALKEEATLLRQQNEELRMEIEQLQGDRCAEIEELVYLRWINACLRYELRNYQPGPDETIARDLSRTLSPKSEEKAKKLILAYANKEGLRDKGVDISELDSDHWSSYLTDSGETDDFPIDNEVNHPSKKRVFSKLMKLLKGKDSRHHIQTPPERTVSVDDILSRYSSTSRSDNLQKSTTWGSSSCSRRGSEDGTMSIFRRIDSISGHDNQSTGFEPREEAQSVAKIELAKYAEALKRSGAKSSLRQRTAAFGSF